MIAGLRKCQGFLSATLPSRLLASCNQCHQSFHPDQRAFATTRNQNSPNVEILAGCTVTQAIQRSVGQLEQANIPEPQISVQHLLASSLHLSWERGFNEVLQPHRSNRVLTSDEASDFAEKINRRLQHEPIQYILGQWDFLDYTVTVRKPLLCPRPETEELVSMVVDSVRGTSSPLRILDIGAGTGVIGLSLADMIAGSKVDAIDVDPVAIETSKENAFRILGHNHEDRYSAQQCAAADYETSEPYDLIVCNPPYIPRPDMDTLHDDVLLYENHKALCGGDDGLDIIRDIIQQLPTWCKPGTFCWMEVDPTHPTLLEDMLRSQKDKNVSFSSSFQDMFGKQRFVRLQVK